MSAWNRSTVRHHEDDSQKMASTMMDVGNYQMATEMKNKILSCGFCPLMVVKAPVKEIKHLPRSSPNS